MVANNCDRIELHEAFELADKLDYPHSLTALNILVKLHDGATPLTQTLRTEGDMSLKSLQHVLNTRDWRNKIAHIDRDPKEHPSPHMTFFLLFNGKKRIYSDVRNYFNEVVNYSKKPYNFDEKKPKPPNDPIAETILPSYEDVEFIADRNSVLRTCLIYKLALHLYHFQYSTYPSNLEQLVTSGILKKLPEDPFQSGHSFGYHPKDKSFILYSVGPDGVDDGGKPIDLPSNSTKNNPMARYRVTHESKGDMVFGLNIR